MRVRTSIRLISIYCRRAGQFLSHDIWRMDLEEFSKAKAWLIKNLQVAWLALDTFAHRGIGFQSVALSYFTTMAAIPFVAVCFAVTDGFGMSGWLEDLLFGSGFAGGDIQFAGIVMNAANNILDLAKSGGFGLISAFTFIWLVIWMMMRVEKVFNNVWGVEKNSRNALKTFGIEIGILILSPLVLTGFFMGTVMYSRLFDWLLPASESWAGWFRSVFGWILFGALMILLLSAMYKWIPAVKVGYRFAFKAAILSGVAFTALQYLYLETQVLVTRINAVYGVIAAIPLFMLWLRFGWLIILYGAQFTYSFQTVDNKETETR